MDEQEFTPDSDDQVMVGKTLFKFKDIQRVVDQFYTAIQLDPVLQVPFSTVQDWPHHIDRLTHFWWTRLGGEPYQKGNYNPVEKHFKAGFNQAFLKRWLDLFQKTLEANLSEEQAKIWRLIVGKIGEALTYKDEIYRQGL